MADRITRQVVEGIQYIGTGESIAYSIDTTKWGDTPTALTLAITDSAGVDRKTDLVGGGVPSSGGGNIVNCPEISSAVIGERYRVEVGFTVAGQDCIAWFPLYGEK